MDLTKEQIENLQKLANTLKELADNPHPKHNGWRIKLQITIKSLFGYLPS